MKYQRPKLVNDEYYHIVVRAVGDTVVFVDESDFFRGIFSIYEFNNSNPTQIWKRRRDRAVEKRKEKE